MILICKKIFIISFNRIINKMILFIDFNLKSLHLVHLKIIRISSFLAKLRIKMNITYNENSTFPSIFSINSTNISSTNSTESAYSDFTPLLKQIHDYLIVFLLICVMFAMGCSVTFEQVRHFSCLSINLIIP